MRLDYATLRRAPAALGFLCALALLPAAALAQHQGHPSSGHPSNPSGGHAVFGNWRPAPPVSHAAPPLRPAVPPQAPRRAAPNRSLNGTPYFRGATHYTSPSAVNAYYAHHPNEYPSGRWVYQSGHRWYNGYWYHHWAAARWAWFDGFYGFWFPLNLATVFVYEAAPGVCQYWDGYEWVPYYDPDTGYYCPY